jgi:transcriptional regulator with XRE-family HTH domain
MEVDNNPPISEVIRAARRTRQLSQYDLARELAVAAGRATISRDLVARWERGHQIPRPGTRQWLSVVLQVPQESLDVAAASSRRRARMGNAAVIDNAPVKPGAARPPQGTPALLPVFRSRVQAGILAATLLNPHRSFNLTELAEQAGSSLAAAEKEIRLLEDAGLLTARNAGGVRLVRAARDDDHVVGHTYGVPQVLAEEFGSVPGLARILVGGVWAERFAGVVGPSPRTIDLLLVRRGVYTREDGVVQTALRRTQSRLGRPVRAASVPLGDGPAGPQIPRQPPGRPIVEIAPIRHFPSPSAGSVARNGNHVIGDLVRNGQLELVTGPAAIGKPFFDHADGHISAAARLINSAPTSGLLLLAQAGQLIGSGLLAQQGLRLSASATAPTSSEALCAQFGHQFTQIESLRRRAEELGAPTSPDSRVRPDETLTYLGTIRSLRAAAQTIAPSLGLFRPPTPEHLAAQPN